MRKRFGVCAAALTAALALTAQGDYIDDSDFGIVVPSFDIKFSTGFNYDLLRSPTNVSFRYPVGNIGFNVPLGWGGDLQNIPAIDDVFDELFATEVDGREGVFRKGEYFKPNAGADQNPNFTIRVDMPMLYGVGSFAYTQNFFMNFSTAIGEASALNMITPIDTMVRDGDAEVDVNGYLSLKSAIRVPLAISTSWETMTFGYAYRVNESDDMVFALNLHRHMFSLDIKAKADIDMLGHLKLNANVRFNDEASGISINETLLNENTDIIDFNSERCNGSAVGRYRAEVWTPTIGVKLWRFGYTGRFGINTKVNGSITGRFVVPRIYDLQRGELSKEYEDLVDDLEEDPMKILDRIEEKGASGLITQDLDSIVYETTEPMRWKMPDGHTFSFDIIKSKHPHRPPVLSASYTKLFGEVSMKLNNFNRQTAEFDPDSDPDDGNIWTDTIDIDMGASVDHIMMLHVNFPRFFFNLGLCAFDIRAGSDKNILGDLYKDNGLDWMRFGDAIMLPIISGGFTLGTKLQLVVEGDLLPLPALRTGVNYFF